jgi:transcriptional regulator with XRE-family HTH domain
MTSPQTPPDDLSMTGDATFLVGLRIRVLREQHGLSLRALAQRCGLSVNAISKIERGENSPTVASLHLLASALRVPITEFFQAASDQKAVHVKRNLRLRSQQNGIGIESLGTGLRNQQLEPFLLTLDERAGQESRLISHPGQEFAYCIQGEVEYEIGDESYHLDAGDSLLFEASQPHRIRNVAIMPSIILLVFQSQEGTQTAHQRHLGT